MSPSGSTSNDALEIILSQPIMSPPPAVTPNFEHPPNGNGIAIAVITINLAVSTLVCLLRIYSRICCVKKARIEDYIGLLAYVFYVASTWVLATITQGTGYFVHMWNYRFIDLSHFLYSYVIVSLLYTLSLSLGKIAIILEWTHIFIPKTIRNSFFWISYAMISIDVAALIVIFAGINLSCSPRERIWNRWLPGTCINLDAFNYFITIYDLVFNVLVLCLPHRVIWRLSMSIQQKIGVSIIFSFGIFASVCAAGRLFSAVDLSSNDDKTYEYSKFLLWGLGEATSAILVFCVPAIPIAFRRGGTADNFKPGIQMSFLSKPQQLLRKRSHRTWNETSQATMTGVGNQYMDEDSVVPLNEPQGELPLRSVMESDEEENPLFSYLGIVKTTEIEVTVQDAEGQSTSNVQTEHQTPWSKD